MGKAARRRPARKSREALRKAATKASQPRTKVKCWRLARRGEAERHWGAIGRDGAVEGRAPLSAADENGGLRFSEIVLARLDGGGDVEGEARVEVWR
jgi:hypothetical protein